MFVVDVLGNLFLGLIVVESFEEIGFEIVEFVFCGSEIEFVWFGGMSFDVVDLILFGKFGRCYIVLVFVFIMGKM